MDLSLPIWQLHADLIAALRTRSRAVVVAPTGSGKSTQVPQMLLEAGFLTGLTEQPPQVVILQPRRVAARTLAARVAWERQVALGTEVGYQIRFDEATSLGTQICYVTEGILLRWLQDDLALSKTGALLFDEFHERNLLSDVALGLAKRLQETRRPDLKLVVMSATLDAAPVAKYLGECPVLVSEGQLFPVETRYLDHSDPRPSSEQAADMVERIVRNQAPGDILVFMPGMAEIQSTLNALRAIRAEERLALIPLHGDLPPEEQDCAFAPNPLRKVVVATNVAETSVTIDGIRHVVDAGLARVARFDAERGIETLLVEQISRASADQRRGRAGRTAPGVCYRLWTESGHLNRPERNTPEIRRSDLAEVVLLLHSLGIVNAAEFDWLDQPEAAAIERAEKLLRTLGAIDIQSGVVTRVGRKMLSLPMHPRYSRMLVEAAERECLEAAALCAALVSGRDLLARLGRDDKHVAEARELFEASLESDFFTLMRAFQFARKNRFAMEQCRRYGIHAQTARQVGATFEQIIEIVRRRGWLDRPAAPAAESEPPEKMASSGSGQSARADSGDGLLRSIMAGFIDQLCVRRDFGSLDCDLIDGRTGTLMRESVVAHQTLAKLFVAASIREVSSRGAGPLTLLGLATTVKRQWIEESFPQELSVRVEHLFDRTHKRVAAVRLVRFLDLVIEHEHVRDLDPAAAGLALARAFQKGWFELPLFKHDLKQWIGRVNLVAVTLPDLGIRPFTENAFTSALARAFDGLHLAKEAQAAPLESAFRAHLQPGQSDWLDELAPTHLLWPDGKKVKLLYSEALAGSSAAAVAPEAQVKLHECFVLRNHPAVCEGKVPVKLWLTGPDGKRLVATDHWPLFRSQEYPKLRTQLQKKYPGITWL